MTTRANRAITQKIYLVDTQIITDISRKFIVLGSTGNEYLVTICANHTCTCPDYNTRFINCKHIYFIILRVLKIEADQKDKNFNSEELVSIFKLFDCQTVDASLKRHKVQLKTDDVCPICLDELDNTEQIDYCTYNCGKAVHSNCFKMWTKNKGKKCVYCYTAW